MDLYANGSDVFAVVAEVTDGRGTVKRLNDEEIVFSVEGPAELLTDSPDGTLTQSVKWGSAPALVRLGSTPGTVTVRASVKHPGSREEGCRYAVFLRGSCLRTGEIPSDGAGKSAP